MARCCLPIVARKGSWCVFLVVVRGEEGGRKLHSKESKAGADPLDQM